MALSLPSSAEIMNMGHQPSLKGTESPTVGSVFAGEALHQLSHSCSLSPIF